jgi:putative transposase
MIHSDQGTQYGSDAWRRFCRSNRLEPSMSRKGNCWDNAVAESFFSSLKKERIKKQIYKNRELAIAEVAHYIDTFYKFNAPPQSPRRRESGAIRSGSQAAPKGLPLNPGNSNTPNSSHSRGEACDIGRNANPNLSRDSGGALFPGVLP